MMMRVTPILLIGWQLSAMSYSTHFTAAENPISQGGRWSNGAVDGMDWCNVQTSVGAVFGVGPCPTNYADPTAIVKGSWGPDQTVQATAKIGKTSSAYYQEIELRLRTTIKAHRITGYEINFGVSHAYLEIVRWNGPLADFTYLGPSCKYPSVCARVTGFEIRNGDVAKATISGNSIRVYVNGVLRASATDHTFATGNPGLGYNFGCDGTYANFAWENFSATDEAGAPARAAMSAWFDRHLAADLEQNAIARFDYNVAKWARPSIRSEWFRLRPICGLPWRSFSVSAGLVADAGACIGAWALRIASARPQLTGRISGGLFVMDLHLA